MSDLAQVVEVLGGAGEPRFDEPAFPNQEYQTIYRDLVTRMEAEASILPGMGTAVSLIIRKIARDYVVGLIADQGHPTARNAERDTRMMQSFRLLFDQAGRADLEHALRTEYVIGLVNESMRVLNAEVEDDTLRVRLKESLSGAFVDYTESVQGRIAK